MLVEGERSSEVSVTSGVPQGSVLGPGLFLFYMNDIPNNITSTIRLFADDRNHLCVNIYILYIYIHN